MDYTALAESAEVVLGTDTRVSGRTLILDGDSLVYRVSAKSKRVDTCVNNFRLGVLELLYLTQSEQCLVHLTHKDSYKTGRMKIKGIKPYQANRTGASRPPLLHEVRDAVSLMGSWHDDYTVQLHMDIEADDAVMIDSYRLGKDGLLYSEDKDLRHTNQPYYDHYSGNIEIARGVGHLYWHITEGGNQSMHGLGRLFFWAQMLMGDTADNIGALQYLYGKRIGAVGTMSALSEFNHLPADTESEVANLVLDGYRKIDQNPYPEGYLLHMQRYPKDSFAKLLIELDISLDNRKFLARKVKEDWFEK